MNNRQKLGYMALGAGILALGITIGQWTTPDIEAQNNGVFDEITYRRLKVVDKSGKDAIILNAPEDANAIITYDKAGEPAILLAALDGENSIFVNRKMGTKDRSGVFIGDGLKLIAAEGGNLILLKGKAGEESINVLAAEKEGTSIIIVDRTGNPAWSAP